MAKKDTTSIGFEDKIWKAADVLRGNLNASEYEGVVLGLIFLKYISDKFEEKFSELSGISGKFVGINYALLPNRLWNKKQKHKKQPWSNVECFAFGGGIVWLASLETSFHAANHTIPPPPSYEGSPHCPKDKNRSPFHGEKPLKIVIYC